MKNLFKLLLKLSAKKPALSLATLYLFISLIILFVASCKKPNEGITLTVDESTLAKAPILVHFANANTASVNQPQDFNVTISGKDAALVQMDGGVTSGFKTSHGFLPLSLTMAAVPSPTVPITFNVSATVPGFAPVTQTVTITKDTVTLVDVGMVEYNNPPTGTNVLQANTSLSAGVSTEGATLTMPSRAGMVETAKITIQPGTQMLDAEGNAISASSLSSNIVDYSATSTTSYGSFPGGFSPTNVVDASGKQVNGGNAINFVSAGLVSIKMSASGTQVRHFSKPIQVSMKLDPNTTNFITGTNIQAGDTVPLWSLDEETGQWTAQGNVTIVNDGGNLVANFQTDHLCCFNLDWSWAIAGHPYGTCFHPLTVRIHCGAGNSGIYDVTIVTPNNQYLAGAHGEFVHDGDVVVFPSVPDIAQCKVVISSFNLWLNPRLPILAQTGLFNPCSQGAIDLYFGAPTTPAQINVTLNISGHCSNKNINLLPSGWFYLYDYGLARINQYPWTCAYVRSGVILYAFGTGITGSNGHYSIKLFNGDEYYMYAYNNYLWYQSPLFTMAPRSFTFPSINGISGTATYNSGTNTLNLSAIFSVHCR